MKKNIHCIIVALAMVACVAMPAGAGIIFDNGGPTIDKPGWISNTHPNLHIADDFSLDTGNNVISDIHWWGSYGSDDLPRPSPWDDDFSIQIFADNGGPSGTALHSLTNLNVTRQLTGLGHFWDADVYEYSVILDSNITLAADTTYWISIANTVNPAAGGSDEGEWVWSNSNETGNAEYTLNDGISWSFAGREMAFNLTDDAVNPPIPEPATLSLLGMGLLGLAARARRKS